jgi:hypothetical protein
MSAITQPGSGKAPVGASYAEGVPWMSQALASRQLQDYYYDSAQALLPFQVTHAVPTQRTIDPERSSSRIYRKFSTTNMQYGEWHQD